MRSVTAQSTLNAASVLSGICQMFLETQDAATPAFKRAAHYLIGDAIRVLAADLPALRSGARIHGPDNTVLTVQYYREFVPSYMYDGYEYDDGSGTLAVLRAEVVMTDPQGEHLILPVYLGIANSGYVELTWDDPADGSPIEQDCPFRLEGEPNEYEEAARAYEEREADKLALIARVQASTGLSLVNSVYPGEIIEETQFWRAELVRDQVGWSRGFSVTRRRPPC